MQVWDFVRYEYMEHGTDTWDMGHGTWDMGHGTWDMGHGTWDFVGEMGALK